MLSTTKTKMLVRIEPELKAWLLRRASKNDRSANSELLNLIKAERDRSQKQKEMQ